MSTEDVIESDNDRLVFFTDAVIAIAITLLAIRLTVPLVTQADLPNAMGKMWPQFEMYFISFFVIGMYWNVHHTIFKVIKKHNRMLIFLNFLWLLFISLLPFTTDLMGRYDNSQFALIIYAINLIVIGASKTGIWLYATHNNRLVRKNMPRKDINKGTVKTLIPVAAFILMIVLSFFHIHISKHTWVFILIALPLVDRFFNKSK